MEWIFNWSSIGQKPVVTSQNQSKKSVKNLGQKLCRNQLENPRKNPGKTLEKRKKPRINQKWEIVKMFECGTPFLPPHWSLLWADSYSFSYGGHSTICVVQPIDSKMQPEVNLQFHQEYHSTR